MRKIFSSVLLILGLFVFGYGSYLSNENGPKEERLSQAEENMQGQRRPIIGPIRRNVRAQQAQSKESAIDSGREQIGQSQITIQWFHGVGIALFVIGAIGFIVTFHQK